MANTNEYYEITDAGAIPLIDVDADMDEAAEPKDPAQELGHKRAITRNVIAMFAATSALAATLPLPIKDAVMLSPIELAEVHALARIYEIPQEESTRQILDAIIELGAISMAARGVFGVIGKGARLTLTAKVKSALIATAIVAGVGAASAYAFEQVYLGKISPDKLGIIRQIKSSDTWQETMVALTGNLKSIVSDDALESLRLTLSEMINTLNPVA